MPLHTHTPQPSPSRGLTDLAGGEPSSRCADTAPPCGSHAGTCRPTERDVWPAERPVPPGTRQQPAPPAGTPLRRTHTDPDRGTAPRTGGRRSTPDELQHSRWGREGRGRWVLRMATHLGEGKRDGGRRVKRMRRKETGVKNRYITSL